MDYNIGLGKQLLPLVVQVLKYCTCPQLRHYFQQPPRCSLWALRPHIRQMWLKALLVILYKVLFHSSVSVFTFRSCFLFMKSLANDFLICVLSLRRNKQGLSWFFFSLLFAQQYPYRDMDGSKVVLHLIHITINTLNAQYHSCRPHATAGPLYSDNSNMSRYSEKEKG